MRICSGEHLIMKIAVFSTKPYDRAFLEQANAALGSGHELRFLEVRLGPETAELSGDCAAICAFVNDTLDRPVLEKLHARGVRLVALRCAGFNNVDLVAARELGITVARVPAYSPEAVAEHTAALILCLNRKIHKAYARVREGNFALDGLLGFDFKGRTIGLARIMAGFGCHVLWFDPRRDSEFTSTGANYIELAELLARSDIISLHCPLTPQTHHLIDAEAIAAMKQGVMIINTGRGGVVGRHAPLPGMERGESGRGALVETSALIRGLKSGQIGHVGLDVYEEESDLFFENLSDQILQDDIFARLLTFPNVLVTGHQAFLTQEALTAIAETTLRNVSAFEQNGQPNHPVSVEMLA
jgi:D-lactate dehydrogenase